MLRGVYKVCTLMYYKGMPDTRIVVTVKTKRGVDETGALIGLQSAFAKFGEWTYEFETWTRNGRVYGSFWSERVPVEELMATLMELELARSWEIER